MFKNFMSEKFFERWSSFSWHLLWNPIFKIWLQWKRKKIFNLTHLQISNNYWLNIFILCIVFSDSMTNALWEILLSLVNKSVALWTHNQMKYIQLQGMNQSIKENNRLIDCDSSLELSWKYTTFMEWRTF